MVKGIPNIYYVGNHSDACPENFSATLFLGGCNCRCAYCMNSDLVNKVDSLRPVPFYEALRKIDESGSFWVTISGGEPTINAKLFNLVYLLKTLGYMICLCTNGGNKIVFEKVIDYVDYVSLDTKLMMKNKENISNGIDFSKDFITSYTVLRLKKKVEQYEIRTTLAKGIVGKDDLIYVANFLQEDQFWILQPFIHTIKNMDQNFDGHYSNEELLDLLKVAKIYHKKVRMKSL